MQAELIDLGVLAVLCILGLFGFGSAYGGSRYFLAGVIGLALGLGIAWWTAHRRQPLIVVVAATALAFFVFGGAAAVPSSAYAGILPSPKAAADLVDGAIQGWARLLTMSPPVGATANLLVIPYLCGLVAGVIALSLALRTRHPVSALPVPTVVLVLSILFGTMQPASLVLQGTIFGAIGLWWIAHLQRARRRVEAGTRRSRRWVGALAMLAVASIGANFGWKMLPGANANPRLILRNYTQPPFDPASYPSPLIDYRRYTNGNDEPGWTATREEQKAGAPSTPAAATDAPASNAGWRADALFKVSGLPSDQRLRLATLDTYDRVVYSVGSGPRSSGYFERVGEKLPEPADGALPDGPTRTVTVDVLGAANANLYQDIWLPVPDNVSGVRFDGKNAARESKLADSLVWNTTTGTGAVPARLAPGDSYTASVVRTAPPKPADFTRAVAAKVTLSVQQVQAVGAAARDFSKKWGCEPPADPPTTEVPIDPKSVYDKILLIAQGLQVCGGLSDGASKNGVAAFPGHSDGRLTGMVGDTSTGMLGNGEQFAPLAALLSEAIGVPARVVMGFRSQAESDTWRTAHGLAANGADYVVHGSDVAAWIEVALDRGHGTEWVPVLDVTPTKPEPQLRPKPKPLDPDSDPPPPPPSIPPSEEEAASDNCVAKADAAKGASPSTTAKKAGTGSSCSTQQTDDAAGGFSIPAWVVKTAAGVASPFLLVGAVTAAIAGLKSRRRRRRRTSGAPDERVQGGWLEVTDLASDLGAPVPHRVTRREAGALIARPEAARLARHADAVVFGPGLPSEEQVDGYWVEVDTTRAAMLSDLSRFGRWKALVSLSSLRSSGRRRLDEIDLRRRTDHPTAAPNGTRTENEIAPT